ALAVLLDRRHCEPEAHDDVVDLRERRGERPHPTALARAVESEAACARARESARLFGRRGGIRGERGIVVRKFAARRARAALVVDERADSLRGEQALLRETFDRR